LDFISILLSRILNLQVQKGFTTHREIDVWGITGQDLLLAMDVKIAETVIKQRIAQQ